MFSRSDKKSGRNLVTIGSGDIPSIVAADLKVVGNLICRGSIEIEGEVEGNVSCSRVYVRRTGSITGDVEANEIQVDGEINGLVKGKKITLAESGRVTGVVVYEALSVKDGAYIDGQCKSSDNIETARVEPYDSASDDDGIESIEAAGEVDSEVEAVVDKVNSENRQQVTEGEY